MRFLGLLRRRTEPEPDHLTVTHEATPYRVAVRRRPASRRMTLRVSATTREIVLTLPPRAPLDQARTFLDAHATWIATRLARLPEQVALEIGARFPVRGIIHAVVPGERVRTPTRLDVGPDGTPTVVVGGAPETVPGRLRRFLVVEAERDLRGAAGRHAARLGVGYTRLTVRDTRSRWGSCSATGALSFSWRLILAPTFVLDYLAAHEVAHLREMNHGPTFWRLVQDLCPRTAEAETWLKTHGKSLHRYG